MLVYIDLAFDCQGSEKDKRKDADKEEKVKKVCIFFSHVIVD